MCLNCDFLADVSGLDDMATHLSENPTHTCQVIVEEGEYRWHFFIQYINTSMWMSLVLSQSYFELHYFCTCI